MRKADIEALKAEADALLKAAVSRVGYARDGMRIRAILQEPIALSRCVLALGHLLTKEGPSSADLQDAVAALVVRDGSSSFACICMERTDDGLSSVLVDLLLRVLEYEGLRDYAGTSISDSFPVKFAEAGKGRLTRDHHLRLLTTVIRRGESRDAESYANRSLVVMDEGLHDLVIGLFQRDTYYGADCAARYASHRQLTSAHHAALIEAIAGSIRATTTQWNLEEFLRNAHGLEPDHVDRILDLMELHDLPVGSFLAITRYGVPTTPAQQRRIAMNVRAQGVEITNEDLGLPAFDPDEVII